MHETETASPRDIVAAKQARAVDERGLDTIFRLAHTANGFLSEPVPRELLERALDLALLGPTSANTLPLRVVFVESPDAKAKLLPALSKGNVEKTKAAPVTAIFAADSRFYEYLPRLMPHAPAMKSNFEGPDNAAKTNQAAFMNATLQGAYFMLAVRALGLDVGPMGGFDKAQVDAEFFPDGRYKSIWLANIGYGDDAAIRPRGPRFAFAEVATFA
jgi:3-hydroxypropanoate dehydrogenase